MAGQGRGGAPEPLGKPEVRAKPGKREPRVTPGKREPRVTPVKREPQAKAGRPVQPGPTLVRPVR